MNLSVRLATERDVPAITTIYNQAIAARFQTADISPVDEANRSNWLAAHNPDRHPVYVAQADAAVAGFCSISPYRPGREALRHTAEISYYVDADKRGKGIGSTLVAHAIQSCPQLGIKTLFAILLDANADSIGLLECNAFERWGHMPNIADFDGVEVGHLYYGRRIG